MTSGQDHLVLYRPGAGTLWILKNENGRFTPVYNQEDPGTGIGIYSLSSLSDRVCSFDYDRSSKQDHLMFYRPGTGTIWIHKRNAKDGFNVVYKDDPAIGIGGYHLQSSADRMFAFDYDSCGKLDHLALYRPGTGNFWILGRDKFLPPVYAQRKGIGGYDLKSAADRVFAFDYDHSGKMDHLVLYRPGIGNISIVKNTAGEFSPVYTQGDHGQGIGGYDLRLSNDRIFAFDYDHSGKLDHLVLYRPGIGTIWILKNENGQFSAVYQGGPGKGIGGYDLKSYADRAFAFDYNRSGKSDHIVLYRPGKGKIWILKHENGVFKQVYQRDHGIGGYDLSSVRDRVFAFDFNGQSGANTTRTAPKTTTVSNTSTNPVNSISFSSIWIPPSINRRTFK